MEKKKGILLVASLILLLALIILMNSVQPSYLPISNITKEMVGADVRICGQFISKSKYDDFYILVLKDKTDAIKVTLTSDKLTNYTFAQKNFTVAGKVSLYEEEVQIEADRIIELQKSAKCG